MPEYDGQPLEAAASLVRALELGEQQQIEMLRGMVGVSRGCGVDLPVTIHHIATVRRSLFRRAPGNDEKQLAWDAAIRLAKSQGSVRTFHCPVPLEDWTGADMEALLGQVVDALPAAIPALDEGLIRSCRNEWSVWLRRQGRARQGRYVQANFLCVSTGASGWTANVALPGPLPIRAVQEWGLSFGAVCDFTFHLGPAARREVARRAPGPSTPRGTRETLSRLISKLQEQLSELEDEDDQDGEGGGGVA